MKSTTTQHKMHDYTPLLAADTKRIDGCSKTNKSGGSRKEKYALRERQKRRLGLASVVELPKRSSHKDDIAMTTATATGPKQQQQQQRTQNTTTTAAATKSKAPPLSKYRRKTANARERTRMREINTAFENLRQCVPQSLAAVETGPTNEKLTKITTLRLAMKYINLLNDVLSKPNGGGCLKADLPVDFLWSTSSLGDGEWEDERGEWATNVAALQQVSSAKTSSPKCSKSNAQQTTKSAKATTNNNKLAQQKPTKRLTATKRKKKQPKSSGGATVMPRQRTITRQSHAPTANASQTFNSSSACSSTTSRASSSACSSFVGSFATTCSADSLSSHSSATFLGSLNADDDDDSPSYTQSFVPSSMSELNSLALESDGESLHLSDPCNSPLQDNFDSLFGAGTGTVCKKPSSFVDYSCISGGVDVDTPLELSLQLLGATTPQPLEFSMEQPPTTCISPLAALDSSFNPFSDFLHEYPEQATLDLFLT